ncbi:hypothetical protein PITCH_A2360009 [uncultured Desulfobacterium sp.]|uniref:Uncharacterized protein n=1 Tax=uncultured Desulfobacterium sp. TaxID=201089 RepID=A0A445MYN2_9BACT|nr:hypothetical protein PITCH_A2360009 [uncultured Desulfobacterium sp.]
MVWLFKNCFSISIKYNSIMKFEWDKKKSLSNKAKHGIDFNAAKSLWEDDNRIEIQSPYPVRTEVS